MKKRKHIEPQREKQPTDNDVALMSEDIRALVSASSEDREEEMKSLREELSQSTVENLIHLYFENLPLSIYSKIPKTDTESSSRYLTLLYTVKKTIDAGIESGLEYSVSVNKEVFKFSSALEILEYGTAFPDDDPPPILIKQRIGDRYKMTGVMIHLTSDDGMPYTTVLGEWETEITPIQTNNNPPVEQKAKIPSSLKAAFKQIDDKN